MRFPDLKTLKIALKEWRAYQMPRATQAEIGKKVNVSAQKVSTWENENSGKPISYETFANEICTAYGIDDAALFIEFALRRAPDSEKVVVIEKKVEGELETIGSEGTPILFTHAYWAQADKIRTRIDEYTFPPHSATVPTLHDGNEYCQVMEGEIEFRLAQQPWGSGTAQHIHRVKNGKRIWFCSYLWHQLVNDTSETARVLIARPAGVRHTGKAMETLLALSRSAPQRPKMPRKQRITKGLGAP